MDKFLNAPGFLGTRATFHSDASLILILVSMMLLTVGWQLKVRGYEKLHCRIQAIAVILNTLVIATVMIKVFLVVILPGIPAKLLMGSYGITALHGLIGTISVVFGMYVVLSAYHWIPQALRFKNYKFFMSTSYLLYLLSTALGVAVYVVVYIFGV